LELWSFGALELWSFGALELWSFGALELWSFGAFSRPTSKYMPPIRLVVNEQISSKKICYG